MITKYKLFENNTIRYISNGEYTCPVCNEEHNISNYIIMIKDSIIECVCQSCDFTYYQFYDEVFNGSEMYSEDEVIEISDEKRNISDNFVSTGEHSCPICNTTDILFGENDSNGEEKYINMYCNKCFDENNNSTTWRVYYIDEFKYSENENGDKINIGDVVNVNLFNLKKYKNIKAKKFNL